MQLITGTTEFQLEGRNAVAIGKFDGIHKGHKKILDELLLCKERGMKTVIFTFDPPPSVFFRKEAPRELTTRDEKRFLFEKMGIDVLIEFPLNVQTAAMPPDTFIEKVLVQQIRAVFIAAGEDLSFGDKGIGDGALLERKAKEMNFEVKIVDKICFQNREISSTFVREAVTEGKMELVTKLMGYPYSITGIVKHGNHIGTGLGMPTLNLIPPTDKLLPPRGVYYSEVLYAGKRYAGISNIGFKPTVTDEHVMGVETFLYDFDLEIYDHQITVRLLSAKRAERKFNSIEELKEQMQADIAEGMEYHNQH